MSMYEDNTPATKASRQQTIQRRSFTERTRTTNAARQQTMQRRSFTERTSPAEPYVKNCRKHFFRNRMALCLLAVACNWGTSLRIANRLATGAIEAPSLDVVVDTCRTSFEITREERARYSNCVESQMNECNSRLDDSIRNEDTRIHELSKENGAIVDRMIEAANNCSQSYAAFRDKTEDWTAAGGRVPLHMAYPESSCTAEDLFRFNQTLLGTQNILAQQAQVILVVDEYSKESTATVKRLASDVSNLTLSTNDLTEYIKARATYDAHYLDQKTQRLQDALYDILVAMDPAKLPPVNVSDLLTGVNAAAVDLLACISLNREARMSDGSRCQPNLASMIHNFSDDAKQKVQILIDALYEYRQRMVEYKNNVSTAYNVAKRFYSGAKAFIGALNVFTGSWFGIGETDFFPVDVEFPDVDAIVQGTGIFRKIDDLWEKITPKIDAFFSGIASLPSDVKTRFETLVNDVNLRNSVKILDLLQLVLPDDYDPPTYQGTLRDDLHPAEEIASFQNASREFVSKIRSAIGMISNERKSYHDEGTVDLNIPTFNMTKIKSKATSIQLDFEDFQRPEADFDLWFLRLTDLSDGFVLVDYVFRLYVSIRLILKYWFATSLPTPTVDIRSNKVVRNPLKMHPARALVTFLSSQLGGFILVGLLSVWLVSILTTLYIPLMESYKSGCIVVNEKGAFVANNLYSMAYNHAYQDGSRLLVEGTDAFNLKRRDACNSRYTTSAALQNNMTSNFATYSAFRDETSTSVDRVERCIDKRELHSEFRDRCCAYMSDSDCEGSAKASNMACPFDDGLLYSRNPVIYGPDGE